MQKVYTAVRPFPSMTRRTEGFIYDMQPNVGSCCSLAIVNVLLDIVKDTDNAHCIKVTKPLLQDCTVFARHRLELRSRVECWMDGVA
jgi:hypothetical protein